VSILDKHPGPWRELDDDEETDDPVNLASGYQPMAGDVVDANGAMVMFGGGPEVEDPSTFADPWAKSIALAAPELLAALKRVTERCEDLFRLVRPDDTPDECKDARALMARIGRAAL
jgi:hypothetical protein